MKAFFFKKKKKKDKRFIANTLCIASWRTSCIIVPHISFNKYLYNGKSEIKVTVNNSSERLKKKTLQLSLN